MSENEAKTDYVCGDECCGECSGEIDGRCHCPVTEKQHTIGMTNEEMLARTRLKDTTDDLIDTHLVCAVYEVRP
jgi:hypothetical protein